MIETISDIGPETLDSFSAIIDVRSPAEFAGDHIPGAINLPVLSNEERAEVGTIYVRESRFLARRLGAAHVARNVAGHLETAFKGCDQKFRPLLYCWRGGMRSGAMATILSQVGWRVGVLAGGYKTWRRGAVSTLFNDAGPLNLVLVDGETGSAKTAILNHLADYGVQSIDLEDLAAHKGSVFGADAFRAQPPQKLFESALFDRLRRCDPSKPIAVEAESSRIGRINIPKRFWLEMRRAPRLRIRATPASRAKYLLQSYGDLVETPDGVESAVDRLRPFHEKKLIEDWLALAAGREYAALAEQLMARHYDPLYERARKRDDRLPAGVIELNRLDEEDIRQAAGEAASIIAAMSTR